VDCCEKHRNATHDLVEEEVEAEAEAVGDFNRNDTLGEVIRRVETRISKVDSMACFAVCTMALIVSW
jgi:hypothetical protein